MGQVLVRNLDDAVIARLKAKAKAEKISVEELARRALRDAVRPTKEEAWAEIERIREAIGPVDWDSTAFIREGRDRGWSRD